jgi:subtilisin family serine protease
VQALTLNGVLEDGPISGATVFLDLNGNKVRDDNEPESSLSDDQGKFKLVIPPGLQIAQAALAEAMLVAHVPATARDRDDNGQTLAQAGKSGFTYLAPAAAALGQNADGSVRTLRTEMPVNILTSLVAHEVLNGAHATLSEAADAIRQADARLQGKDLFARFTEGRDPGVAAYASFMTVRLGDVRKEIFDEARREAADQASREGGDAVNAAARAEAALTSGAAARTAALAAVARIASEREDIAEAVRELMPDPRNAPLLSPADRARSIREKIAEVRARRESEPTISAAAMPSSPQPGRVAALEAANQAQARTRYMVVFKSALGSSESRQARDQFMAGSAGLAAGARIEYTYDTALRGFAVSLPAAAADAFLDAIANNPNVDRVEIDSIVSRQAVTQTSAPWGLDRADQRSLPLSSSFSWTASGTGVRAFVIDTGILSSHAQFSGRIAAGFTAIADGRGTDDCNGHGTHVAGTIGGSVSGLAKSVTLVPVRVLDCSGSGTLSGVVAGIDWVAANAPARSVMNLSLGGTASSTLDQAVAGAIARGVTAVVAAGNSAANACNYSPARVPEAITVAASNTSDQRASFSNFGACIDLFAPGESIVSTWYTGSTALATLSGTSMASPHVAGAVAQLLEVAVDATPSAIAQQLISRTTLNMIQSAGTDSPNRLVYADANTSASPPPEPVTTIKVSVASMSASAVKQRNGWTARVSVKVKRADGTPAPGAVVRGDFTVGGKGVGCTTDATGTCTVSSGSLSGKTASVTYTMSTISGTGYAYDAASNTVSSIAIARP